MLNDTWTMRTTERIYISWPISGLPSGATVKITVDGGSALTASWDGTTLKALFAGADADPGAAIATLGQGSHAMRAQVTDTPEILDLDLGTIVVR